MDRPSDIFRNAEWDRRRREEEEWDRWFTGEALSSQTTGVTDKDTGEPQKRYPLLINPIEVYAEIHRDVLFGMAQNYDEPPVRTVFQDGKSEGFAAQIQPVYDRILRDSNAASIFVETGLLMQVRGGHAFKVAWEPDNPFLNYRTRLVGLKSSWVWPVYDQTDYWNLHECWIGYPIDEDLARERYHVDVRGFNGYVLYMEHWTRDAYRITIEDKVARKWVGGEWLAVCRPPPDCRFRRHVALTRSCDSAAAIHLTRLILPKRPHTTGTPARSSSPR